MAPNSSAQPSSIRIRNANKNDAPGILQCLAAAFEPYRNDYSPEGFSDTVLTRETLHERLKHMHMLVAVTDDQIVGTIGAAEHPTKGTSAEWLCFRNGTARASQRSCFPELKNGCVLADAGA